MPKLKKKTESSRRLHLSRHSFELRSRCTQVKQPVWNSAYLREGLVNAKSTDKRPNEGLASEMTKSKVRALIKVV